jgi:hypothetical protein
MPRNPVEQLVLGAGRLRQFLDIEIDIELGPIGGDRLDRNQRSGRRQDQPRIQDRQLKDFGADGRRRPGAEPHRHVPWIFVGELALTILTQRMLTADRKL